VWRAIKAWRYERLFSSPGGYALNRGVYRSFAEANRSAPRRACTGEHKAEYSDRIDRIFPYDYPVLYWLHPVVASMKRVFDIGGNIGVHYYSYRRYLDFSTHLVWQVCEVPRIAESGIERAKKEQAEKLLFTSDFKGADGADLIFAAGSVQYIEFPRFARLLQSLNRKPIHILINKVPLYNGEEFVSLQNGGSSFTPRYVFNREEFVGGICQVGYDLIDSWLVPDRQFLLPGDSHHSFGPSSGLYFRASAA
jgi:putative methyltransferase (TIGR04325 family)